jgi:type VI secretion system protein ImpL
LIFLDTPGGWVTEGASEDGQETSRERMRLLRKYRGRQPLDGLIVVVPADDLLGLNEDELEDQATNVREVVDLIHEKLDFRFPIYVLVTKCDLVEGFVDFFRGLPSKRRHEILGWSNPDPNEPDAELIVEKGFSTVRGRLQNYRLEMLGKVARRTQARRLFFFTEEFRGLERPLSVFTQALFGGDRYSEPPVFRGFYFSSGTQEGAPLGKAISGVAKAFGLPVPQAEAAAEESTKRSYFLLELFRELMVGDEGLVGRSASHWWRRRRNTALGVFAPARWNCLTHGKALPCRPKRTSRKRSPERRRCAVSIGK